MDPKLLISRIFQWEDSRLFAHILRGRDVHSVTYGDLKGRAKKYASSLIAHSVRPGDLVIIILPHGFDLYASFLGAMLAGAIPTILPPPSRKQDPLLYWSSQQQLISRTEGAALITFSENIVALKENDISLSCRIIIPELVDAVEAKDSYPGFIVQETSAAFLQHSSGTTGLKKGVVLPHRSVLLQLDRYARTLELSQADLIATWLPLYHDMGLVACFLLPAVHGVPIVSMDAFEWVNRPRSLLRAMSNYKCTLCWLPNFAFHHIASSPEPLKDISLASVRSFINCSEPCRPDSFDTFGSILKECGGKEESLQVCYAMAESVFAVSQTKMGSKVKRFYTEGDRFFPADQSTDLPSGPLYLSSGPLIPGVQARIIGEDGQVLNEGSIGKIEIKADFLFTGYFKNHELTQQKIVDGWYQTGDRGGLFARELIVQGRWDDIVIYHGKKFSAFEIESCISSSVSEVKAGRVVVFADSEQQTTELTVVFEKNPEVSIDEESICISIRETLLQNYEITPRTIMSVPVGWIVKSTSGKISRKANREKYNQGFAS